ncbi:MAG: beta-N-acetylhexosaminidase, partial [Victivallaceae bacterium]
MKKNLFNLIPIPAELSPKDGKFIINGECQITLPANLKIAREAALQLQHIFRQHSRLNLTISEQISVFPAIIFTLDEQLPAEGYALDITPDNIIIAASSNAGFLYAVVTLRQLLPLEAAFGKSDAESIPLNCLSINDTPRFPWRGMMLDVSRHDFSLEYLKQHLELMHSLKLNHLHLHLTDSQSWRLEIKAYPELTEKGGHTSHSGRYANFYTQEQMRELIDYAAKLNIEIIPEIDIPGHSKTAAGILGLGCEVGSNVLCAGNPATFEFIDHVFAEVAELFPAPYIHVGGDECSKEYWKKCPCCQSYMREHNIKDEFELQSHIIRYAEKVLASHGKRLIGWDEILEGGLAPDATVMSWRGTAGGIAAANSGHDVIMSPTTHCYLDYYQSMLPEPKALGAYLTLKTAYDFDPAAGLSSEALQHVLGAQGNLWTEFIPDERQASYMINPRLEAIAEAVWSPPTKRNWRDFARRIMAIFTRFDL